MRRLIDSIYFIVGQCPAPVRKSVRLSRDVVLRLKGFVMRLRGIKAVPAYWADALNFGDMLTPELLKTFGVFPRYTSSLDTASTSRILVSCGSILGWQKADFSGYVLGAGLGMREEAKSMPFARFLCVRGALTRDAMGLRHEIPLGDPGLLVERIVNVSGVEKSTMIGIVPHQIEMNSPRVSELVSRLQKSIDNPDIGIMLISTRRTPQAVIRDIATCRFVLSSSLHGLVVSDALHIPSARVHFEKAIGDFKFDDYYSAYGESCNTYEAENLASVEDAISICRFPESRARLISVMKKELELSFRKYLSEVL